MFIIKQFHSKASFRCGKISLTVIPSFFFYLFSDCLDLLNFFFNVGKFQLLHLHHLSDRCCWPGKKQPPAPYEQTADTRNKNQEKNNE